MNSDKKKLNITIEDDSITGSSASIDITDVLDNNEVQLEIYTTDDLILTYLNKGDIKSIVEHLTYLLNKLN